MLADTMLRSETMLDYVIRHNTKPGAKEKLLDIHKQHTHSVVDQMLGKMKNVVIPMTIGRELFEEIKNDVVQGLWFCFS